MICISQALQNMRRMKRFPRFISLLKSHLEIHQQKYMQKERLISKITGDRSSYCYGSMFINTIISYLLAYDDVDVMNDDKFVTTSTDQIQSGLH